MKWNLTIEYTGAAWLAHSPDHGAVASGDTAAEALTNLAGLVNEPGWSAGDDDEAVTP